MGNDDVWIHDVESGSETPLTHNQSRKMFPVLSADGSQVAYGSVGNQKEIYVISARGGATEIVCADCGLARSWMPDGDRLIYQGGEPRRLGLLTIANHEKRELLRDPRYGLYSPRISPDGHWVAFFARIQPNRTRLTIAPFPEPGSEIPPSKWIAVTSGEFEDDKPRWSPDGTLLYFTSMRDGFRCIWAQRIEPATKTPLGVPFIVQHFHQARRSMMHPRLNYQEMTVARDKIVFALGEVSGNIWMSRPQ
jgi:Tol biopolymer transport system component